MSSMSAARFTNDDTPYSVADHRGIVSDNEPASASIAIMTEPSQVSVSLLISNPSCSRSSDSNSTLLCKCFYVDQVMPIHNLAR